MKWSIKFKTTVKSTRSAPDAMECWRVCVL